MLIEIDKENKLCRKKEALDRQELMRASLNEPASLWAYALCMISS